MEHTKEINQLKDKLSTHMEEYEMYVKDQHDQMDELVSITKSNATAISALTNSTKDMVDAWSALYTFGRFAKYISSFGVLGAVAVWIYSKFPINL